MTDREDALGAIARAVAELVPQLTDRLARHDLGEIEVSSGDVRVRVARGGPITADASAAPVTPAAIEAQRPVVPGVTLTLPPPASVPAVGVPSPAVGFFVYAEGLGPGLEVDKGDALGQVEMLGVRHDVRAPRRGTIRHLVAESGEAVEYGQVVLELEATEAGR